MQRNKDESWRQECDASDFRPDLITRHFAILYLLDDSVNSIEQDFWAELAQIQAESIGWIPLDESAYLHVGSDAPVIQVVGVIKEEMAGSNVLLLT